MFGAIATAMMIDWEGKFAFDGGGLGFDPEFAQFSGTVFRDK